MRRVKFLTNKVFWRLSLATETSREFVLRANCLAKLEVLSYSALAGMTLQLPYMLHTCVIFGTLPIIKPFLSAHS